MARHVISVCIFCFICATHSPCASHASIEPDRLGLGHVLYPKDNNPPLPNSQPRERLKRSLEGFEQDTQNAIRKVRLSGNTDSNANSNDSNDGSSGIYIEKLFKLFGDGDTMTLKGFEELVDKLNLYKVISNNLDGHHIDDNHHSDINIKQILNNTSENNGTCLTKTGLKKLVQISETETDVNHRSFTKACPALVYSLLSEDCTHKHSHLHGELTEVNGVNVYVWFYSIVAVVVISACGLLALVVIPLMQKRFYKPLIQFLVALAVGTLAGDALLHLLPHAMSGPESEHNHGSAGDENMWKGFVAMMGLTFFFVMERFILLIGKWRKRNQKKMAHHSHVRVVNETCMDKYNSIPYCFQDIMQDTKTKYYDTDKTATTMVDISSNSDGQSFKKSNSTNIDKAEANQNMTQCTSENAICTESNKMLPANKHEDHQDIMVILREHETSHHGHSHAHGHVHAAPQSFSAVAWMVIMGDGLHNFTDGMAIGAAFSGSVAGGFSTTVAVFCHELPHEMGDFAMLLKAGMTIKQAVFYNLLSSLLCVVGNIFGVWLGNTEYASSWVFAAAAGMFLYIALVDMIPELSSAHEDESNINQCLLHLSGLFLGVGIMTLIAFYEHDLKHIFKEPM